MLYEAFMAGAWASIGSTIGKLTGTTSIVGDGYIIWACLLVLMVLVNTWGCRYYLRSLDAADNSSAPTVISAASSYVLSVTVQFWLHEFISCGDSIKCGLYTLLPTQRTPICLRYDFKETKPCRDGSEYKSEKKSRPCARFFRIASTILLATSAATVVLIYHQGVIGICFFGELSSMRWWAGAMLIVIGLALVARTRTKEGEEKDKEQ